MKNVIHFNREFLQKSRESGLPLTWKRLRNRGIAEMLDSADALDMPDNEQVALIESAEDVTMWDRMPMVRVKGKWYYDSREEAKSR